MQNVLAITTENNNPKIPFLVDLFTRSASPMSKTIHIYHQFSPPKQREHYRLRPFLPSNPNSNYPLRDLDRRNNPID